MRDTCAPKRALCALCRLDIDLPIPFKRKAEYVPCIIIAYYVATCSVTLVRPLH